VLILVQLLFLKALNPKRRGGGAGLERNKWDLALHMVI
jgi:hypothetical protein